MIMIKSSGHQGLLTVIFFVLTMFGNGWNYRKTKKLLCIIYMF